MSTFAPVGFADKKIPGPWSSGVREWGTAPSPLVVVPDDGAASHELSCSTQSSPECPTLTAAHTTMSPIDCRGYACATLFAEVSQPCTVVVTAACAPFDAFTEVGRVRATPETPAYIQFAGLPLVSAHCTVPDTRCTIRYYLV